MAKLTAAGVDYLPEPSKFNKLGDPLWSGKTIFSAFIPNEMNFMMKNKFCSDPKCTVDTCPHQGFVHIKNGELVRGIIDKTGFGAEVRVSGRRSE